MSSNNASAASSDALTNPGNHKGEYFDQLFAKIQEVGAEGYILITGIKPTEEEGDDDEEEDDEEGDDEGEDDDRSPKKKDTRVYTKEEMETLRVILITERRDSCMKKARKMATRGQDGDFIMMFNTHSGNCTIMDILRMTKTAKTKKTLPERFDALFGLTIAINRSDCWLHDNELWGPQGELEESMVGLGKAWSTLLAHTDAELGIDSEYTRPGIEALLNEFAENVNDVLDRQGCALFKWDAYKTGAKRGSKKRKADEPA